MVPESMHAWIAFGLAVMVLRHTSAGFTLLSTPLTTLIWLARARGESSAEPVSTIGDCDGRGVHRTVHDLDLVVFGARREQRFGGKRRECKRGNNRTEEDDFGFHV